MSIAAGPAAGTVPAAPAPTEGVGPEVTTGEDAARAEALFREARRRARRRRLVAGIVVVVVVAGAVFVVARIAHHGGVKTPLRHALPPDAPASAVPPESLQFRRVLASTATGCGPTDIGTIPPVAEGVDLYWAPSAGLPFSGPGQCMRLGPSVLSISSVSDVMTTRPPAGTVVVSVALDPATIDRVRDSPLFDAFGGGSGASAGPEYAVVLLGQVLMTSNFQSHPLDNGVLQMTSGLAQNDPRPAQIAAALRSPLVDDERNSCDLVLHCQ